MNEVDKLQEEYKDTVKKEEQKSKLKEEKKALESIENSAWGQMGSMFQYSKDEVTRAQGFED